MARILLLGGTADATRLAHLLAAAGREAIFSYAGRTRDPAPQPLPTRIGGFGGAGGLAAYLAAAGITHVVDATHPFAAEMSRNAVAACAEAGIPLVALERQPWRPGPGDQWRSLPDIEAAVAALPEAPSRIFLAIGRQNIAAFATRPEHFYLLRYIEAPETIPLPHHVGIAGRGPFTEAGDRALLAAHAIALVIAKNAGGTAARAKLDAARALRLPVLMIERPPVPERPRVETPEAVLRWLAAAGVGDGSAPADHDASVAPPGAERGV